MQPPQTRPSSALPAMLPAVSVGGPAVPRRKRRPRLQDAFTTILVLSCLCLVPRQGVCGQLIPFLAWNQSAQTGCLQCEGPWFRGSGEATVPPGAQAQQFYAAEETTYLPALWLMELSAQSAR
jgi:hypothetical protein